MTQPYTREDLAKDRLGSFLRASNEIDPERIIALIADNDRLKSLIKSVEQNDAFMQCCPWCGEQAVTQPPEWDTYRSIHSVSCSAFTPDGQVK